MNDIIRINTEHPNKITNILNHDLTTTVAQYRAQGKWPFDFISAKGLVSKVAELSTKLDRNITGLEIGISRGDNIVYFLENISSIEKLYCIDPYVAYEDWNNLQTEEIVKGYENLAIENFKEFGDRVVMIKDFSANVYNNFEDEFFDYIFIDGDHSYEGAKEDMKHYYSKVKTGGIFSGHDINLSSVRQALQEFIVENNIDPSKIQYTDFNVWYWYK